NDVCPVSNPEITQNGVVSFFFFLLYALKQRRFGTGTLALRVKGTKLGYELKFKLAELMEVMGIPNISDIFPVLSWFNSSPLASDSPCKLDIFGHDSDPLSVNSTEIGVFKETHQISLGSFLKSRNGATLEPHIGLKVLSDFPNEPLERKLPYQKHSALLISLKATIPRLKRCGFFTPPVAGANFSSCLSGQLLTWCLSSGGLPCCLLHASHFVKVCFSGTSGKTLK
ncbi:hypothetical protein CUMW_210270, partial [Citrus unshiu]